jgi:hypothetical protein
MPAYVAYENKRRSAHGWAWWKSIYSFEDGMRQNDFSLAVLAAKAVKKIYHRSLLLL